MGDVEKAMGKRWKSACKVLFGQELGGMEKYVSWLLENNDPIVRRKSSLSGKEVSFAAGDYAEGSKWVSFDEVDFGKKSEPISPNDLKDINSLASALQERFSYCGNIILGNSGFVEKSSNISDSFYMNCAGKLGDCKYISHTTLGRLCEDCFGCNGIGESKVCVKCYETFRDNRCLEVWMCQRCSDLYYCHNLSSSQDCMFSFNLKGARNMIGNVQLEQGQYRKIKAALLGQMKDELEAKKRLPSLVELAGSAPIHAPPEFSGWKAVHEPKMDADIAPIEKAFRNACRVVLGSELPGSVKDYAEWLQRHTQAHEKCASAASGKAVHRRDYCCYFLIPRNRLLTAAEAQSLGPSLKMNGEELGRLNFDSIPQSLGNIAYFASEYLDGTNRNLIECATSTDSSSCLRCSPVIYSKYCAYSFWPRSCEHAFGCQTIFDSEFCINCYQSVKLKRCAECDNCRDCSDSYFCHNAENCRDCMFCFNVKNLKFAIGNAEVGREKFMEAKEALLKWMNESLSKTHGLKTDIYNVGCAKKKR